MYIPQCHDYVANVSHVHHTSIHVYFTGAPMANTAILHLVCICIISLIMMQSVIDASKINYNQDVLKMQLRIVLNKMQMKHLT